MKDLKGLFFMERIKKIEILIKKKMKGISLVL